LIATGSTRREHSPLRRMLCILAPSSEEGRSSTASRGRTLRKEAIHERFGLVVFQLGQKSLRINYFDFQMKLIINEFINRK